MIYRFSEKKRLFGFFGKNAPLGSKTIIPPLILHTLYGLIVGIVIQYAMEYEVGY